MGLRSFIRGQLIDVIEWLDSSQTTLVWRFPDQDHEIKMGAKLTVREGQVAVFINEGQLADVFPPGLYTLTTQNMPILTALRSWSHGFESPFKAEVYFVSMRQFLDQNWGTPNPIMLRDPEFGVVRLRAFGIYSFRVSDAAAFMREVVGTDGHYTTKQIEGQLRRSLVSAFTTMLAREKVPALDLAAHYPQIAEKALKDMRENMQKIGIQLTSFLIENISLPEELEKVLDKRSSMGILGDVNQYAQFQAADASRDAARQPGGLAGAGIGLGAGMAMGNLFANQMNQNLNPPPRMAPAAPAPVPHPSAANATCPACQAAIPTGSKFCTVCGTRVAVAGPACMSCGATLAPGSKFCSECGQPQKLTCPSCKAELAPGTKFCSECGQRLG